MGFLWNEIIMKPMVNILTIFYSIFSDNFGLSIRYIVPLSSILTASLKPSQFSVIKNRNEYQFFGDEVGFTQGLGLQFDVEFNNFSELIKKLKRNKKN